MASAGNALLRKSSSTSESVLSRKSSSTSDSFSSLEYSLSSLSLMSEDTVSMQSGVAGGNSEAAVDVTASEGLSPAPATEVLIHPSTHSLEYSPSSLSLILMSADAVSLKNGIAGGNSEAAVDVTASEGLSPAPATEVLIHPSTHSLEYSPSSLSLMSEDTVSMQNGVAGGNSEAAVDVAASEGLSPATEVLIHPSTQNNIRHSPPRRLSAVSLCACVMSQKIVVVVILSVCTAAQVASTALQWVYATKLTFHHQINMGGVNVAAAICMVPLICIPLYVKHLFGITMERKDWATVVSNVVVAVVKIVLYAHLVRKALQQIRAPYADLSVFPLLIDIAVFLCEHLLMSPSPECFQNSWPLTSEDTASMQNGGAGGNSEVAVDVTANEGLSPAPAIEVLIHPPMQNNIRHSPPGRHLAVSLCGGVTLSLTSLKIVVVVILSVCMAAQVASTALQWVYATKLTFHHQINMGRVNVAAAICMVPLICIPLYVKHLFGITIKWKDWATVVSNVVVAVVKILVYAHLVRKALQQIRAPYADLSVFALLIDIAVFLYEYVMEDLTSHAPGHQHKG